VQHTIKECFGGRGSELSLQHSSNIQYSDVHEVYVSCGSGFGSKDIIVNIN
jgi:hypothetical protein